MNMMVIMELRGRSTHIKCFCVQDYRSCECKWPMVAAAIVAPATKHPRTRSNPLPKTQGGGGPAQVQYQLRNRDTVLFFRVRGVVAGNKTEPTSGSDLLHDEGDLFFCPLHPPALAAHQPQCRFTAALPPFASNTKNGASKCRNLQRVQ